MTATSRGVGELILAAVRMRAKRIVLGLGGSACTDGGAGLVTALGGRLLDALGTELSPGGAALARLDHIDVSRLRDVSGTGTEFIVATDVDNPLLGPGGAAAVYAPQKGASAQDVTLLEEGLARWADVTERSFGFVKRDEPGAGAAGGLGFAALGFLGAVVQPGIELMLDLLGFADRLSGARLVVTGEGALDEQTLHGKAPAGVARAAAAAAPDLPVVAVAGVCSLSPDQLSSAGIARAYALADIEPDLTRCLEQPGPLLEELAGHIARDWLAPLQTRLPYVSPSATTMSPRGGQNHCGQNHVNATSWRLFWSELPAGESRAGRRTQGRPAAAPRAPLPPRRPLPLPPRGPRRPLPPRCGGAGDGTANRHDVTLLRS